MHLKVHQWSLLRLSCSSSTMSRGRITAQREETGCQLSTFLTSWINRSRRPNSQDKNKQEASTDLSSELSDIKRHQLSPGLVTVSNVLKGFGGVLASFFDEDFVTARVL
jgi:hypothetical protein